MTADSPHSTHFFVVVLVSLRVRANLHVVLCFSPVGDAFRSRCRRFPGLINCTQIDLFRPWPRDALVKVSLWFLEDMELGDDEVGLALCCGRDIL